MKRIFILIVMALLFFGNIYAENINSTRVNEALKDSLDRYGRWKSITFDDGTSMTTAASTSASTAAPRIVSMADGTSFTPTADTADINTHINTQVVGALTANNPSGSPVDGQKLILRIKSTNTQTYTWGSGYRFSASNGTLTVTSGDGLTDYVGLMYNAAASKWDVLSISMGY